MRNVLIFPMIALVLSAAGSVAVRASESMPELDGFLPEVVEKVGILPEPVPGDELAIADAIEMAAERNASLEVMKAEVERSRWQTATAWAIIMPMVEASASYVRADHEDVVEFDMSSMLEALGIPVPEGTTSEPTVIRRLDNLNGSLSVSMSLINVAGWYTIAAAQSGDKLARLTYEQVRDQIQSGVVQAFLAAMMTRSVIDLQRSQVVSAAHHLDFALKKFAAGSGLKIDVVRAEADLVKARQELLNANLAYESARDALGILTGAGGLPVPSGDPQFDLSSSVPNGRDQIDEAVSRAVEIRNDIKLQQAGLDLAKKSYGASWGGYVPTLVGGWSGSYQFTEPASFGSVDRSRWNLFLNLSIPLFRFDRIGEIKQKKLAVKVAELKVDEARENAARDIREAERQYRTAVANHEISLKQVELAREAFQLVEAAYLAGAGSSLEVTDAMRNRLASEVGALTSELRVRVALVNLNVALGRRVQDVVR